MVAKTVESIWSLPQPGASQPEIQFRRLLLHCQILLEQHTAQSSAHDWRLDPKFHCVRYEHLPTCTPKDSSCRLVLTCCCV